ncbi:uncharacterized protein B0P05DRAFT_524918 [Gilbertella persicaria]|uniref:uncharacterized protein n=1 Tax=Gilbertella persicaria TaxID=101096 RepID=UPI00221E7E50|nr:uncharacterized protein B0P05DRAFT_524918 [Gilbertella persicaria]KAI8092141.1 hypothetical protein B0P05DRAFT_524918 [Gilbertella persicaria]
MNIFCWLTTLLFTGLVLAQDDAFDKTIDRYSFKTVITNASLSGFTIEYKNYYKIVTNTITSKSYCLVGFEQALPEGCHAETTIHIPVKSFSVEADSYSVVPFIELLGLQNNMTKTPTTNISSPCVRDGSADTSITSPDMVFSSSSNYGAMYVGFSADKDTLLPLQKASWLMYIGAFFDLELKSSSIYNQIVNNYNCHKNNLVSNNIPVSFTTFDPSHSLFTVHSDIYYHQLVQDAGGRLVATNVAQPDTFQVNVSTDQLNLAIALRGAEFIMDTSVPSLDYDTWLTADKPYFTADNKYTEVGAVNNNKVYTVHRLVNTNHISGKYNQNIYLYSFILDWNQRSAARPDLALLDLIKLLYPDFSVASNSLFPLWFTPYNKVNQTRQVLTTDMYGGCQDIATNAFAQSQCTLGASIGSTFIPKADLSKEGKAGVSVGVVLFFAGLAGLWLYRRYRLGKKRHHFYQMEDF